MSVLNQKTINKNITFKGVGLHSGLVVNMTVKPAAPNSGIIFKRIDLKENNIIIPNIFNVSSAVFCTTISNESGVSISTIEHLMAALYGVRSPSWSESKQRPRTVIKRSIRGFEAS